MLPAFLMARSPVLLLALLAACGTRMIRVVEEGPGGPESFRVGVLHLKSLNNDRGSRESADANLQLNYDRVERLVRLAAQSGAKVIVTPEYVTTGISFHLRDRPFLSTYVPATPTKGPLWEETLPLAKHFVDYARLADELDVWLVVNVLEREPQDPRRVYYNTLVALDPAGRMVARYRKINLYIREHILEESGDEVVAFDTPYGRFGMLLCVDCLIPWTWGKLRNENKVDFFLVSSLWEHTPFVGSMAMDLFTLLANRPILWSNQARMWLGGGAGVYRPGESDVAVGVWAPSSVVVANLELPDRLRERPAPAATIAAKD